MMPAGWCFPAKTHSRPQAEKMKQRVFPESGYAQTRLDLTRKAIKQALYRPQDYHIGCL
jgi:hypothetical protein